MSGSQPVADAVVTASGGAESARLNVVSTGGNNVVCTVQVDRWVYVVGPDTYVVARYPLEEWLGEGDQREAPFINTDDAVQASQLLKAVRAESECWRCPKCQAWIHTSGSPQIGAPRCSVCGQDGIRFAEATVD